MTTKTTLSISRDLALPLNAVTQTFAFIARRGAGKTYAAMKLAEQMLLAHMQIIPIDPVGNWYGLRLGSDGQGRGFEIPVFGGEHGDLPLAVGAGALIADLVVDRGISVVLDVSSFRKGERKTFVTDFAEQFFHRKKTVRTPVHVFVEEAQVFVPERPAKGEERMLGAFVDLVRLGRNYGIGVSLISQRPQSVSKEALNQTEALLVLQTGGAHERKALADWIVYQGIESREVLNDVPAPPAAKPVDEDALYERFKARLLVDAPALLRLVTERPELHVTVERPVIEVDTHSLRGRIGQLIAGGRLAVPMRPAAVVKYLTQLGYKAPDKEVAKELAALVELGILIRETNGYHTAPGLKVVRKELE